MAAEPVWVALRAHAGRPGREVALWALSTRSDFRSRAFAAALLAGSPETDLAWWRLTDALRDPNGAVASVAAASLRALAEARPRALDWAPAAPTLRLLLGGTNPSAFPTVADVLVQTRVNPALAPVILGGGDMIRSRVRAAHDRTRSDALRLVVALGGPPSADRALRWLDDF